MTIAEVCRRTGYTQDTLRYYERIGLLPPIKRTKSGMRDYDDRDISRLEFIRCMRNAGMPVETLIEYVQLFLEGDHTVDARKEILIDQKALMEQRVADTLETIKKLEHKIENYDSIMMKREKEFIGETEEKKTEDDLTLE